MVRRQDIESHVLGCVVLYRDQENLTGLVQGEKSERVRKLQIWLAGQGLYTGTTDGQFGDMTREAIEKFQTRLGLPATGAVDPMTAAQLDISMNPRRPRLYS
ncbi:MAG: peptidoglycan-binding protein [bacterium]|nr:peptidoglycan-binding protein [bacterium]